jgi:hypothetical protein
MAKTQSIESKNPKNELYFNDVLSEENLKDKLSKYSTIANRSQFLESEEEKKSKEAFFENYYRQRYAHRENIIRFSQKITVISLLSILFIIIVQGIVRVFFNNNFAIFDGNEFEILSISVFGQSLGVVIIITKSLWDGSELNK